MKNMIRLFFLTMLLLLTVSCSFNNNSKDNKINENKVTIKGYYEEPASLKDKETIILNGVSKGEYVEILVEGEIIAFEYVKLEWNESQSNLIEKETLQKFDKLLNQTLVIKTYIPEGIPVEKVKWKSSSGKSYEHIIQEDGESSESGKVIYLE